jgi:hypothetical protein
MQVAYSCPHCENTNWVEVGPETIEVACAHCEQKLRIPPGAFDGGRVNRCLACPSTDLFIRKDFPQRLGVLIVTVGLLASCVAWAYSQLYLTFAILFATALIDVVLYVVIPDALMCYRCGAMYRGAVGIEDHGSFNLETHERHRQQKMRLAEAQHKEGVGGRV